MNIEHTIYKNNPERDEDTSIYVFHYPVLEQLDLVLSKLNKEEMLKDNISNLFMVGRFKVKYKVSILN